MMTSRKVVYAKKLTRMMTSRNVVCTELGCTHVHMHTHTHTHTHTCTHTNPTCRILLNTGLERIAENLSLAIPYIYDL